MIERLREKVSRAGFHRLDRGVDVPMRRHHHDRQSLIVLLDAFEKLESRGSGQYDIAENDVWSTTLELLLCLERVTDRANIVTPCLDAKGEHFAKRRFVIDDEDIKTCRVHLPNLGAKPETMKLPTHSGPEIQGRYLEAAEWEDCQLLLHYSITNGR